MTFTRAQEKEAIEARKKSLRSADPKTKKTVGRPKKANTGVSARALTQGRVAKKVGRPRKTVTAKKAEETIQATEGTPVKRGRGRPKKQQAPVDPEKRSPKKQEAKPHIPPERRSPRKTGTLSPQKTQEQPIIEA